MNETCECKSSCRFIDIRFFPAYRIPLSLYTYIGAKSCRDDAIDTTLIIDEHANRVKNMFEGNMPEVNAYHSMSPFWMMHLRKIITSL